MLIIIEVVNKQILKIMKNLFYSLVVILGLVLTSCGGSSESTPSTDSTSVDTCKVDSCVVDSCRKDTVK
jgi:fructose-bisphosphate aldolase class 1